MPKKKASTKKTAKKPATKGGKASSRAKKKTTKKAASKKKTTKKPAAKKKTAKKPVSKKTAKKPAAKKTTKKPATKKAPSKTTKKPTASSKKKAPEKPAAKTQAKEDDKKTTRKGITIVQKKTSRRSAPKSPTVMPTFGSGLASLVKKGKPLIPSGPDAEPVTSVLDGVEENKGKKLKTPFNKRELDKFKQTLIEKLNDLLGDVANMENEALRGSSGSLSHLPQHLAEQGSDAADQMLSLDLAASDRKLIKEIIDALKRIEEKTFGLCELTGEPINRERLDELPWARHSIAAARELERRYPQA